MVIKLTAPSDTIVDEPFFTQSRAEFVGLELYLLINAAYGEEDEGEGQDSTQKKTKPTYKQEQDHLGTKPTCGRINLAPGLQEIQKTKDGDNVISFMSACLSSSLIPSWRRTQMDPKFTP